MVIVTYFCKNINMLFKTMCKLLVRISFSIRHASIRYLQLSVKVQKKQMFLEKLTSILYNLY